MPKGMILAAGRGTRLAPLTDYLPKPLLPVANLPTMAHGMQCLHRLGVREACINASYRGQQIRDAFPDDVSCGLRLHWRMEESPMGTAGGLKGAQPFLHDDVIVVIAGDAMTDLDIAPLLDAHREKGAFASLGTLRVADPSQYGVVVTDGDSRIVRFQEKPAPGTEISHQANTGIYIFDPGIFDLIPAGEFSDFALNVFPEILRRGLPFYAFPLSGYWTDIGTPGAYLRANMDYLAGGIRADGYGVWSDDGNFIAPHADVSGTQLVNCVIGAGAVVPHGCALTECVVWPDTVIRESLVVSSAIFTPWGGYQVLDSQVIELTPASVSA